MAHALRFGTRLALSYSSQLRPISTFGAPTHLEIVRFAVYQGFAPQFEDRWLLLDSQAYIGHEEPYCSVFLGWEWHIAQHGGSNTAVGNDP